MLKTSRGKGTGIHCLHRPCTGYLHYFPHTSRLKDLPACPEHCDRQTCWTLPSYDLLGKFCTWFCNINECINRDTWGLGWRKEGRGSGGECTLKHPGPSYPLAQLWGVGKGGPGVRSPLEHMHTVCYNRTCLVTGGWGEKRWKIWTFFQKCCRIHFDYEQRQRVLMMNI